MPIAPPPAHTAASIHARAESSVVREINRARAEHGLRALRPSRKLARLAARHSRRMLRRDRLSHNTGGSLAHRMRNFRHAGETLAWSPRGSRTGPRGVVRAWMASDSHRAVLLDPRMRRIGVGRMRGAIGRQRGVATTADLAS